MAINATPQRNEPPTAFMCIHFLWSHSTKELHDEGVHILLCIENQAKIVLWV